MNRRNPHAVVGIRWIALVVLAAGLFSPISAQTVALRNDPVGPKFPSINVHDDPIALGRPLSYWLNSIRDRDADMETAFDAIFELGPEAWRAVPELTRIVSEPFSPIRIDRDSRSEMHSKLRNIHLRAAAIDGLGAIGETAASSAEAVIRWGLTLKTIAPAERPANAALIIELVGMDVLERMRVAGAVAQFGPGAAGPVQKLLESPDDEARKFSAAILNDAAVPIAVELMNSESCADRKLGLSLLSGMWPVVPKDHLMALREFLVCSETGGPAVPTSTKRKP